jgi:hypothetical protein
MTIMYLDGDVFGFSPSSSLSDKLKNLLGHRKRGRIFRGDLHTCLAEVLQRCQYTSLVELGILEEEAWDFPVICWRYGRKIPQDEWSQLGEYH